MEKDLELLANEVMVREYVRNGHSMEVTILIAMKEAIELYITKQRNECTNGSKE